MIKELIYEQMKGRSKRERESHYPSEIGKCRRAIWYDWKQTPESDPISEHSYLKMELGNSAHSMVFDLIRKSGMDVINEISGKYTDPRLKYPVSYRIDNVINTQDKLYVVEIKSTYAGGLRALENDGAKLSDIEQLKLYMILADIKQGILLYIARDNGMMFEFMINLEPEDEKLLDKFIEIENTILSESVPKRDFEIQLKNMGDGVISDEFTKDKLKFKSDWHCLYCRWLHYCWANEFEQIKDHKFFVYGEFEG